jgi:NAD(P)H dehydrogenase (quinone)
MILVTGAAGKTGLAVIKALAGKKVPVRALVHKETQRDDVMRAGASETVLGNLAFVDDLLEAMHGVSALYHIPPNVHPQEWEMGKLLIDAARGAGIGHFVCHSVLHPQLEAMPHHWRKLRVEEYLIESGVPFTILQPAVYMQNIVPALPEIKRTGAYLTPYPVKTILSLVDLEDLAEVAALVVGNPEHQGAIYELVGTGGMSQRDIAGILSEILFKPIQAQQISIAYWENQVKRSGLSTDRIDTLVKMFRHYEQFGFTGNPGILGWLLGREPTSLKSCLERENTRLVV